MNKKIIEEVRRLVSVEPLPDYIKIEEINYTDGYIAIVPIRNDLFGDYMNDFILSLDKVANVAYYIIRRNGKNQLRIMPK